MKNRRHSTIMIVIFVACILGITCCSTKPDEKEIAVRILGVYPSYIHARIPGSTSWNQLSFDSNYYVTIPNSMINSQSQTDIQVRETSGVFYTRLSQYVTNHADIFFTENDLDPASDRRVTIYNNIASSINNSAYTYFDVSINIDSGSIRLPESTTWSSLFTSAISSNSSQSVIIPGIYVNNQNQTDLQLRSLSGLVYTKVFQVTTHQGGVTFVASDFDPTSTVIPLVIQNNTGNTVNSGYAKLPSSTTWSNIFTTSINSSGYYSIRAFIIPRSLINTQNLVDIQLRSGDIRYTKLSQPITPHCTITFSSNDMGGSL